MTKRQSWCSTFVAFFIELSESLTSYRQPRLYKKSTFLGGTVLSPILTFKTQCLCYKLPKFTFEARVDLLVMCLPMKIRIVCLDNIYDRKSFRRNYFRFISPLFRMSRVSDFSPKSNNNNNNKEGRFVNAIDECLLLFPKTNKNISAEISGNHLIFSSSASIPILVKKIGAEIQLC